MQNNLFIKNKWHYLYERKMTYAKVRLYQYGYWKGFYDFCGYQNKEHLYRFKNGNCFGYLDKTSYEGLYNHLLKKFSDKNFLLKLKELPKETRGVYKNYIKFADSLPRNYSLFKNDKLINILEQYYEREKIISIYFWIWFEQFERALYKAIEVASKKEGLSVNEVDKLFKRLALPLKPTPLEEEKISLAHIALSSKSKHRRAVNNHWRKYGHMKMYDINYEAYKEEYYKRRLQKILKNKKEIIRKRILKTRKKFTDRKKYLKKILADIQNKNLKILINLGLV